MLKSDYNSGLTTIEDVREDYKQSYSGCHIRTKIELKAWLNHSESRNKNNHKPFTFDNYVSHMRDEDYLEQIKLNIIDCDDLGGKEKAIQYLENRIKSIKGGI